MSGNTTLSGTAGATAAALSDSGTRLLRSPELSELLGVTQDDWTRFAGNWEDLLLDTFMADGGTYRYRRYGQFDLDQSTGELDALPHEPYRQERFFNHLNGGVDRVYEPLTDTFANDPLLRELLMSLGRVFSTSYEAQRWQIKLHPVRITAGADMGQPAPEGRHRDGVTYVGSLLMDRLNVTGGESTVYDADGNLILTTTLSERGDLLLGDDMNTFHAVTPVHALDPDQPAHRDVLVLNYTALPAKLG